MKKTITISKFAYLDYYRHEYQYQEQLPSVIICPGGAYFYTSQRESYPVVYEFLSQGYNVFVLHYSTMMNKKMIEEPSHKYEDLKEKIIDTVIEEIVQPAKFPQPLIDLAKSIIHIKSNYKDYNVDKNEIILCGFSAGAHLCSMMSVLWKNECFWQQYGIDSQELGLKAQVIAYGFMNSLDFSQRGFEDDKLIKAFRKAILGKIEVSNQELERLSPSLLVHDEVYPSFIWHTRQDDLIPVSQALEFAGKLFEHNIPCELHIYDCGNHGLSIAKHNSSSENHHVASWFALMMSWLNKLEGVKNE